ncbi:MAG: acetolactate synthase small subunit [Lachnospirales bacterium]
MKRVVLSILVENQFGVLSRISGLFSKRGFNIDSFSAAPTIEEHYTRITIAVFGDEELIQQIKKQLEKLIEVVEVLDLSGKDSVRREIALIKVEVNKENRDEVMHIITIFRGNIIDVAENSMIVEVTGKNSKINAVFDLLSKFNIIESSRTGVTALMRGSNL